MAGIADWGVSVSLTAENKRALKALLGTGRWHNESEIIRYGLHLVIQEARRSDYAPMPKEELAAALAALTPAEKREEAAFAKLSARTSRKAMREDAP